MNRNETLQGHGNALFTILVWGTTFISTKVLLRDLAPVEILVIRFLLGYLALWLVRPRALHVQEKKRELLFAAAGLCGVTLYFLMENVALTYTLASNVGVIISISPFFAALFDRLFCHGPKPGLRFYFGFLLALGGVACISFRSGGAVQLNPVGDLLAAVAAIVWAVYSLLTRKIGEYGYGTVQSTRRTFFYGLLFMLPAACLLDFHPNFIKIIELPVLANMLFLGLGASALCFVTWGIAVKRLGAVKTCVYIYMVPVVTVLASVFILKEEITPLAFAGIVLTLIGLFLSEKGKEKSL